VAVVQEAVEHADRGGVPGQEPAPGFEWPVGRDAERAGFVGGGDELEQQLGAGVVEWGEAELVEEDEVVAEQRLDEPADGVVGQASVEGLDEVGGGGVPDSVPVGDGGVAQGDEQVGLAGPGRADEAEVLGGADPFQ
jgi:hypothetical protein